MKFVLLAALTTGPTLAPARGASIECPGVGVFAVNGMTLDVAYALPEMGFRDGSDTATLISAGLKVTGYQTQKWGASVWIPNALRSGAVRSAEVAFSLPETAEMRATCFLTEP